MTRVKQGRLYKHRKETLTPAEREVCGRVPYFTCPQKVRPGVSPFRTFTLRPETLLSTHLVCSERSTRLWPRNERTTWITVRHVVFFCLRDHSQRNKRESSVEPKGSLTGCIQRRQRTWGTSLGLGYGGRPFLLSVVRDFSLWGEGFLHFELTYGNSGTKNPSTEI